MSENLIEQNMLRPRAKRLPVVTKEMWEKVNQDYRDLVEEFIAVQSHSPQTKKQYMSALRQYGWFIYNSMNNKPLYKITKRDFLRFLSYLRDDRRMSSSALNFRKAAVSSLCNYIENVVAEEEENYSNFRNFTRGLPAIPRNKVYDKQIVTYEDYKLMMDTLEEDENYLGMAWLATSYLVGTRRAETIQLKTEILNYEVTKDRDGRPRDYVDSHIVRGKGDSIDGKPLQFMISLEVFPYWEKWIEERGYEHEYIFTTRHGGKTGVMSDSWGNYFCSNVLSNILGRRINPHIFKASCITYHLDRGVPIEIVSRFIAQHESVETTIEHYDLREFEDEKDGIFR